MEERAGFEPAITELQSVALPTWLTLQYGAAHRIRTCKPFQTNGFQDRLLTTRTYGIIIYDINTISVYNIL